MNSEASTLIGGIDGLLTLESELLRTSKSKPERNKIMARIDNLLDQRLAYMALRNGKGLTMLTMSKKKILGWAMLAILLNSVMVPAIMAEGVIPVLIAIVVLLAIFGFLLVALSLITSE